MNSLIVLFSIFIFYLVGFVILNLFKKNVQFTLLEKIGYAWGIGVGIIALQLFIYTLVNIPWNNFSILIPWIISVIIIFFRNGFITIQFKLPSLSIFGKLLVILIVLLNIFVCFESTLRPIQAWDGYANWLFRPKIFFLNDTIDHNYFRYTQDDYPMVLPLMSTFGYILLDKVDDMNILMFYFMFYFSIGILFFSTLKKYTSFTYSLLFTFLLISTQNIIRHGGRFEAGYADLALGYYFFTCLILLFAFINNQKRNYFILLSILLSITSQIKNDAMPFVITIFIIMITYLFKNKQYKSIPYLLIPLVINVGWIFYKLYFHYPPQFIFGYGLHTHFDQSISIVITMCREFLNIQNWNILWLVFILVVFLLEKSKSIKIIIYILIIQWFAYFISFLLSPTDPIAHVINVIDRLYLHLAPTAVFISAILIFQAKKIKTFSIKRS